eukprot:1915422-Rhodomonas_salina.1
MTVHEADAAADPPVEHQGSPEKKKTGVERSENVVVAPVLTSLTLAVVRSLSRPTHLPSCRCAEHGHM